MSDHPPPKGGAKPSAPSPSSGVNMEVVVILLIFLALSGGAGISFAFLDLSGVAGVLQRVHGVLVTVATAVSMLALVVIVYAFMRIREISREESVKLGLALNWNSERKQKNERWLRVEGYMASLSASDWKMAILEADNMLDQIVERMGYQGASLGERMKNIEASDFPYLDDAWSAHKMRNTIAHTGAAYELTRSDAEQTINVYHRVFKELGYL